MTTTPDGISRCTVYRGHGLTSEVATPLAVVDDSFPYRAGRASLRTIMSREIVCARPDLDVATIVRLVIDRRVGCLPVVDDHHRPVGIITKFDLVEELDAAMRGSTCGCPLPSDLKAQTADDVMMPIALTLNEHAPIAHAAAMMMSEDTHHVLVIDAERVLVGVVSAKDIVGSLLRQRAAELTSVGPGW